MTLLPQLKLQVAAALETKAKGSCFRQGKYKPVFPGLLWWYWSTVLILDSKTDKVGRGLRYKTKELDP